MSDMNDMDDEQIKAEIDGIMKGVKSIMQKIEDAIPKTEPSPEQIKDNEESLDSSKNSTTD
jgi:peptidoglycan hydrolase CwlO-like protein